MATKITRHNDEVAYAVLLYPPVGKPRVTELPQLPRGYEYPMRAFDTRAEAEAALQTFLKDHPEYRRWNDGAIQP